ncbi:MAG: PQQ-binding-like beta-propeller repeat protein [Mariniphaga sp.]|jgi:outer membrane protein assembly factor BamB|nr:PQQ-binding-like beta-propeller repeat protein [Mariniphaga sp.]
MRYLFLYLFLLFSVNLVSQEIVEFRGIQRTGHYNETGLLKEWPEEGPELLLKIEGIGKGFSQPVVADGKIFVTGIKIDETDVLSAYNLNGQLLWETDYGRSWIRSYSDSRCTPTYENGKLYVVSGTGQLSCVDAQSGEMVWQVDAIDKYNGEIHRHGDSESPLLVNDLVVYTTGGENYTMVAFKKSNGSEVWKTKSLGGAKSYASPVLIKHKGNEIILAQTTRNLIAIDPFNGNIIWNYDLIQFHKGSQGQGAQTNPAISYNNEVFVTSGYDHPATMFSITPGNQSAELKWKNTDINTHHGGVVLVDGKIYGSNWQHNSRGRWACVDWETGETHWDEEWFNKGSVIYADGMLYLYEEKSGNVALVEPSAEKLKIVSTFAVNTGTGPHWAHPAIYNGKLFIRHGDVLMVYNIKA